MNRFFSRSAAALMLCLALASTPVFAADINPRGRRDRTPIFGTIARLFQRYVLQPLGLPTGPIPDPAPVPTP